MTHAEITRKVQDAVNGSLLDNPEIVFTLSEAVFALRTRGFDKDAEKVWEKIGKTSGAMNRLEEKVLEEDTMSDNGPRTYEEFRRSTSAVCRGTFVSHAVEPLAVAREKGEVDEWSKIADGVENALKAICALRWEGENSSEIKL